MIQDTSSHYQLLDLSSYMTYNPYGLRQKDKIRK